MIDFKRGERVKFLNETGTGTVTRIIDSEMVMVRTEDGFEYPVLGSELIRRGDENIKPAPSENHGGRHSAAGYKGTGPVLSGVSAELRPSDPASGENSADSVQKREEGDKVYKIPDREPDIYIAVVPFDHSEPVGGEVSLYIINDSEWSLLYHCAVVKRESKTRNTIAAGLIEPGIKINSGDFHIDDLFGVNGSVEFTAVAYTERINESAGLYRSLVKPGKEHLSKRSAYIENDFFDEDAFIVKIEKRWIEGDNRRPADDNRQKAGDNRRPADDNRQKAGDNGRPADDNRQIAGDNSEGEPENASRGSYSDSGLKAKTGQDRVIKSVDKPPAGKREGKKLPREIDLHIGAIVDNSNELSPGEILNIQLARFRTSLEGAIISKERSVVYIHGTGEGKLKHEIRRIIDREYPACSYQDASFREYGYGATLVIFKSRR